MNPVDGEVSLVHGEYFVDTFSLGNPDKCCVGKTHRTIGIFPQKLTDASKSTKPSGGGAAHSQTCSTNCA